jgi:hypothetical protein
MSVDLREVTQEDILRLSVEERKKLIIQIVHTFEDDDVQPLTSELEAFLDDLLANFDTNPQKVRPWREVMDEVRDKYLGNA